MAYCLKLGGSDYRDCLLGGMVWIGSTKVFDYSVAKATAEKRVLNNMLEHPISFQKDLYTLKEKKDSYELTLKKKE